MKKVKKWRYYCEFCKKSGGSGGHISTHEKSCTMNPNRVCRMCRHGDGTLQAEMSDMLEVLKIAKIVEKQESYNSGNGDFNTYISIQVNNEKEAVKKLREVANNCPVCMFAAIKQTTAYPMTFCSFDFKKEKERFWSDVNQAEIRNDYGYGY